MSAMHPARPHRLARLVLVAAAWAGAAGAGQAQIGSGGPVVSNGTVGYIDGAIPGSQLRVRFDAGYNNPTPSRGEFFYSRSPTFPGERAETNVNFQEVYAYAEAALGERFSLFAEVPVRFLNPTVDQNVKGLGDVNFGFKWAFFRDEQSVVTLQLRGYAPTGNGTIGLGSSHPSIEPALLGYSRLTERLSAEGEFRVYVPLSDTPLVPGAVSGGSPDFASNVLRYGIGFGYDLFQSGRLAVVPVTEVVGWTFLDGQKTVAPLGGGGRDVSAAGDTIIDLKAGARFKLRGVGDLYFGYGHAVTGERMYRDVIRAELRLVF
jgi:hypothetical protein